MRIFFNSYAGDAKDDKGLVHFGSSNIDLLLNMMVGLKSSICSLNETINKSILYHIDNDKIFREVNKFTYSLS